MRYIVVMLAVAIPFSGCGSVLDAIPGSHPEEVTDVETVTDTREWRLVFLYFDANELVDVFDGHVEAIRRAPDQLEMAHAVIIRESDYRGTSVSAIAGGEVRPVTVPDLPTGSLFDGDVLERLFGALHEHFPASRQALFIAGHGRGWSGVGYSEGAEHRMLASEDLRTLAEGETFTDTETNLLVFDSGWSAFAEFLYPLRGAATTVISAGTNLHDTGINYGTLMERFAEGHWSFDAMVTATKEAFVGAGTDDSPVVVSEADLSRLSSYLRILIDNAALHLTSPNDQFDLRSTLLQVAVPEAIPGDVHIRTGDLPEADRRDPLSRLLLHLITIDEIGQPSGHATHYRAVSDPAGSQGFFHAVPWAPDFFRRSGFLFDLWYREF